MLKKIIAFSALLALIIGCGSKKNISSSSSLITPATSGQVSSNSKDTSSATNSSNSTPSANSNGSSNGVTSSNGTNSSSSADSSFASSSVDSGDPDIPNPEITVPEGGYFEDFENINLDGRPASWGPGSAEPYFKVVDDGNNNKALKHTNTSNTFFYKTDVRNSTDVTMEAMMRIGDSGSSMPTSGEAGIAVRHVDGNNYYGCLITYDKKVKMVTKNSAGTPVLNPAVSSVSATINTGEYYRLRLSIKGQQIKCYLGDSTTPTVQSTITSNGIDVGGVALKGGYANIYFDEVYYSLNGDENWLERPAPDIGEYIAPTNPINQGITPSSALQEYANPATAGTSALALGTNTVHQVANASAFNSAVNNIMAGDIIEITANITGSLKVSDKDATREKITIRAKAGVTVNLANITIQNCINIEIYGFNFPPASDSSSGYYKIIASKYIKIHDNVFDHLDSTVSSSSIIITCSGGVSSHIEIYNNTFKNKNKSGSGGTKISGSYIKTQYDAPNIATNMHVHHNIFKNIAVHYNALGVPTGDSDRETIVLGINNSQNIETFHIIENNIFDNCDGENEIITVKVSKVTIRNNYFYNCFGSVSVRFGTGSEVSGNVFIGDGSGRIPEDDNFQTGGIRIYGTYHKVFNNFMYGLTGTTWRAALLIDNGDTDGTSGDNHQRPRYVEVYNNTLVNNATGISLGTTFNESNYKSPPQYTKIYNNVVKMNNKTAAYTGSSVAMADAGNTVDKNYAHTGNLYSASFRNVTITDVKLVEKSITYLNQTITVYVPASDSALINVGVSCSYILKDLLGNPRVGNLDVGAFEYTA